MKRTLSVLLSAVMLFLAAPPSVFATDIYPGDPADQITDPDEKPGRDDVERAVRVFLRDQMHFNDAVTSGILANLYVECRFDISDRYVESGGFTSYGLCQWNRERLQGLIDFCAGHGYQPNQLEGQLQYMKYELENTEKTAYKKLSVLPNDVTGAYDAGLAWAQYFERSSQAGRAGRAELAKTKFWPVYGRYLPIGLNVPYFPAENGDSLAACYAMTEGYLAGYQSGDSRVAGLMDGVPVADLYTEVPADANTLFECLHTGIPAILKTDRGAELVIGYDGESDTLEAEGFRTLIPTPAAQAMPGSYGHLDSGALSGAVLLIRKNLTAKLPVPAGGVDSLTMSDYARPVNLPADGFIRIGGRLTAPGKIVSVSLTLTDGSGKVLAQSTANPDAAVFDLSALAALSGAENLSAGNYTLTLAAKDDRGETITRADPLTLSDMPLSGRISSQSGPDPLSTGDARVPAVYRVNTPSGLNVRQEPSVDGRKLGAIGNGTQVKVTALSEDGLWGRIDYDGRDGWICLEYAAFVEPLSYTLIYDAAGGAGAPDGVLLREDTDLYLPDTLPYRTGYRFLGWSENPISTVGEYRPGDPYIGEFGGTLYAVWEEIVPVKYDVSGDGLVNARDTVLLQQYLNGYPVTLDYVQSDSDGDGILSMRDIALIQKHLNGLDG